MGYIVDIFLVLSNFVFIIPSGIAFAWGRGLRSFMYFMIIIASGSYHLCDSYTDACLFNFKTHQHLDFIFATSIIPLTAYYFIYFNGPPPYDGDGKQHKGVPFLEKWLILASITAIAILVVVVDNGFMSQGVIILTSLLAIVVYWIVFKCLRRGDILPLYDWNAIAIGVSLALFSIAFFILQNFWYDGYWLLHSLWHIMGAVGQCYFLVMRPPVSVYRNLESSINGDGAPLKVVPQYSIMMTSSNKNS